MREETTTMERKRSGQLLKGRPGGVLRLLPVALGAAFLAGLGVFAYFASVLVNFPGEVGVSTWVQSWQTLWLDALAKAISVLGLLPVAGPIVGLASAMLYLRRRRAESVLLLATVVVGRLLALGIKEVVQRPRPSEDLVQVLQAGDSYSFPSGHVMYYVVFLGALALILVAGRGRSAAFKLALGTVFLASIAIIGLSRIYLGVHWLGDVVGGCAFGAAVVAGAGWIWRRWTARGKSGAATH